MFIKRMMTMRIKRNLKNNELLWQFKYERKILNSLPKLSILNLKLKIFILQKKKLNISRL